MVQPPEHRPRAGQDAASCPICGAVAVSHCAGPCLDRWVHGAFLQRPLAAEDEAPPYSASPQQRCLDDLIAAPRWPQGLAVMQTSLGCTVARQVRRSVGLHHYDVVAAAANLPLAVCRAAVCVAPGGTAFLDIT